MRRLTDIMFLFGMLIGTHAALIHNLWELSGGAMLVDAALVIAAWKRK